MSEGGREEEGVRERREGSEQGKKEDEGARERRGESE